MVSHFLGSHVWYAKPQCLGCHKKEVDAMSSSTTTGLGNNNPHRATNITTATCKRCHGSSSFAVNKSANSTNAQVDYYVRAHTNSTSGFVSVNRSQGFCIYCHSQGNKVSNITPYYVIISNISAHKPMVNTGDIIDNSYGCIECHTGVKLNITFSSYRRLNMTYNRTTKKLTIIPTNLITLNVKVSGSEKAG